MVAARILGHHYALNLHVSHALNHACSQSNELSLKSRCIFTNPYTHITVTTLLANILIFNFLLTAPTQFRPAKVNKYCLYFLKRYSLSLMIFMTSNPQLGVLFVKLSIILLSLFLIFLLWTTSLDKVRVSAFPAFFCFPASFGNDTDHKNFYKGLGQEIRSESQRAGAYKPQCAGSLTFKAL